jgi:hypothetical protein
VNASSLEADLCQAYREQAEHYARALEAAELLAPALARGDNSEPLVAQLAESLAHVSAIESRIAPAKQHFHELAEKPSPELQTLLSHLAGLIQKLRDTLAKSEHEARRQQANLAPELDTLIRRQHMRRAYGDAAAGS